MTEQHAASASKRWEVEVFIDEHDARTRAKARLHTRDTTVEGVGFARQNPADTYVAEIGDELAVARALSDLAHQLLLATASDIEAMTHQRVTLPR